MSKKLIHLFEVLWVVLLLSLLTNGVTAQILYEDDFNDGNCDGWSTSLSSQYIWDVDNGELRANGGSGSGNHDRRNAIHPTSNIHAGDAVYGFDFKKEAGDWYINMIFTFCDDDSSWDTVEWGNTRYSVSFIGYNYGGNDHTISIHKYVDGINTNSDFLWQDSTSQYVNFVMTDGQEYGVKVIKCHNMIKVYVDSTLMLSVLDPSPLAEGNIAFVKQNCVFRFDNVLIDANPDIDVQPTALDIYEDGSGSEYQPQDYSITQDRAGEDFIQALNDVHARGLVIPEYVKEYWRLYTPQLKYNLQELQGSIDWSANDSPVKNQGSCGSCWAFSAIGLIENLGDKSDLAEQVIVSCAPGDCGGGWYWDALEYIHNYGVPPESCYPYIAANGNCSHKCSDPAYLEKVTNYTPETGLWGEPATVNDLKYALQNGPLCVAMRVPEDGSFDAYSGGIYNYNGGYIPWENNGHGVLLVGYNDEGQYFTVKNSWGIDWGENRWGTTSGERGYFRIAYDDVIDDVHFGCYGCAASGVYTEGGDEDAFTIYNMGVETLDVTDISSDKTWLTFNPSVPPTLNIPGVGSEIIKCIVDWNNVPYPSDQAVVTIQSNDPDEDPYPDPVMVTAYPLPPPPLPSITVEIPNGGEIWQANSSRNVIWSSYGTSGSVKIEYSYNNGSSWIDVIGSTPDDGSYSWTVPNTPSTQCLVRITDVDGSLSDQSDGNFSIDSVVDWLVLLEVSNNGTHIVRGFGGDQLGTDGFDNGLDVMAPPVPQDYYAYFNISEFPNYLSTDIRGWNSPYEDSMDWALKVVNAEGLSTTITWDPDDLPSQGYFTLIGASSYNMRTDSSVTFSGNRDLTIRYRSTVCMDYVFTQQGWYMVSLPVIPEDSSVTTLFPTVLGSMAFGWDPVGNAYSVETEIKTKYGYWIAIPGATMDQVCGEPLDSYKINCGTQGWYMIGSVLGSTDFTDPDDNPDGQVLSPAFGWNAGTGSYYTTTTLEEKNGYWAAVFGACDLTVGGGGSGSGLSKSLNEVNWSTFSRIYGSTPPEPPELEEKTGELVQIPTEYGLSQNTPNPFNPETTIRYQLPENGHVSLIIYNMMGQEVKRLVDGNIEAGYHEVVWDGWDELGSHVGSGVYIVMFQSGDFIESRKLLLVQ